MTILVFNQTSIVVNVLDRNHNLWRLWATYSKDLQQSVDLFFQPCLCLLIDILWCNFWFSIPFPLDEYEMFTVTWVFEGALWHPEALTYPWPKCIIWNGCLCQFFGPSMQWIFFFFSCVQLNVSSLRNFVNDIMWFILRLKNYKSPFRMITNGSQSWKSLSLYAE